MRNLSIKNHGIPRGEDIANVCPLCGKKINLSDAATIESQQDPDVLFAICPKCEGSIIISSIDNIFGTAIVSIATDLGIEDLHKFGSMEKISSDEILDLHALSKSKPDVFEAAQANQTKISKHSV